MRLRTRLPVVAGVICGALVLAGVALAAAKTTITMQGPDQVSGTIHSPSTKCLGGRTVRIYKERKGATSPNPSLDTFTGNSTKSQRQGTKGTWDMGTLGLHNGRYYALATRTTTCKRGISNVVKGATGS